MTPELTQISIALTASVGVFLVFVAAYHMSQQWLSDTYQAYTKLYFERYVLELQYPEDVRLVVSSYLGGMVLLFVFFLYYSPMLALLVLPFSYFFPIKLYEYQRSVRRKKINDVLPNVLQQLAANTKNTGSLTTAIQEVAVTAPIPMNHELRLLSQQEKELVPFESALQNTRDRINSHWFDIVSAVLLTSEEKGGKSSEALQNLSRVFVQLKTMQGRIDTATSQGRMSMKLMLAMPFVVVSVVSVVSPNLITMTMASPTGYFMLGLAAFFYILAVVISIWLSKVKL